MNSAFRTFCSAATIFAALTVVGGQAPESQQPAAPAAQTDLVLKISGSPGAPPHYAVPDFIPLTQDKETVEAARLIAQVLWDNLAFEREVIGRVDQHQIEGALCPDRPLRMAHVATEHRPPFAQSRDLEVALDGLAELAVYIDEEASLGPAREGFDAEGARSREEFEHARAFNAAAQNVEQCFADLVARGPRVGPGGRAFR